MKILFLTNNEISKPLYDWLMDLGEDVVYSERAVTAEDILEHGIDFIISYNYRYLISPSVIKILPHRIINLHISYLPWNRGASPNLWSFLENTPCGVTIHEVDEGLDTGDILIQENVQYNAEDETLKSSYEKSHETIQRLFKSHWQAIKNRELLPKKQEGKGSFHRTQDMKSFAHLISYNDSISEFIQKVKQYEA